MERKHENIAVAEGMPGYPLHYLEILIGSSLAPEVLRGKQEDPDAVEIVMGQLVEQRALIEAAIRIETQEPGMNDDAVARVIRRYYDALLKLLTRADENRRILERAGSPFVEIYIGIYQTLLDIIAFIETEFDRFRDESEPINPMYLKLIRDQVATLTGEIIANSDLQESVPHGLVVIKLREFLAYEGKISMRMALYHRELAVMTANTLALNTDGILFTPIDKGLIYLNFNSKQYIHHLTDKIVRRVDVISERSDKLHFMRFLQKQFKQLLKDPGAMLNEKFASLDEYLTKWFNEEIEFLHSSNGDIPAGPESLPPPVKQKTQEDIPGLPTDKVLCKVSADQLAIFFRASYMSGLLIYPSVSNMFEHIANYLSTTKRTDLSPKSMRAKSYSPEENEKRKVKAFLSKLIQVIDEM